MRAQWQVWLVASVAVHASLVSLAVVTLRPAATPALPEATSVDVDVASTLVPRPAHVTDPAVTASPLAPTPPPAPLGGTRAAQNVSSDQPGERGDGQSVDQGRLLAARADGVNLDPHLMNNLATQQEQRIRSARTRASPQDDRRTPHPDVDPWLATGAGLLLFRAPPGREDPALGARVTPGAAVAEGRAPEPVNPDTGPRPLPWGARPRIEAGVAAAAQGRAHRASGPSATGRPPLEVGHPSTTADVAAVRPSDDEDASLLAAALSRAYVAASVQDGPRRGPGVGGVGGGGAPGTGGGVERGGAAHPLGDGDGWLSLASADDRYVQYFHEVRRRLDPLWARAFPTEDALQLRQGTVALAFVIQPDGTIADVQVVRRSGVAAFDANVRAAIAAAHVPPIPPALGRAPMRIRHAFQFRNPVVR